MKSCSTCGVLKPLDNYYKSRRISSGYVAQCKTCRLERDKRHWSKVSSSTKNRDLQRTFGITLDDYYQMFEAQGGLCAICKQPPGKRALAVDHNHTTGQVRALLCGRYNVGLGQFQDSTALLTEAILYLEKYREIR